MDFYHYNVKIQLLANFVTVLNLKMAYLCYFFNPQWLPILVHVQMEIAHDNIELAKKNVDDRKKA